MHGQGSDVAVYKTKLTVIKVMKETHTPLPAFDITARESPTLAT